MKWRGNMCTEFWMTGINLTAANLRTGDGEDWERVAWVAARNQKHVGTGGGKGRLVSNQREPGIP